MILVLQHTLARSFTTLFLAKAQLPERGEGLLFRLLRICEANLIPVEQHYRCWEYKEEVKRQRNGLESVTDLLIASVLTATFSKSPSTSLTPNMTSRSGTGNSFGPFRRCICGDLLLRDTSEQISEPFITDMRALLMDHEKYDEDGGWAERFISVED